jgi:hypothetical protein
LQVKKNITIFAEQLNNNNMNELKTTFDTLVETMQKYDLYTKNDEVSLAIDVIYKKLDDMNKKTDVEYDFPEEVYAIANADNTKFICDVYETTLNKLCDLGMVALIEGSNKNLKGHVANYVVLDDNFIRVVKINKIDLSKVPIIQKAPTMQCQNTHTFDKVKEVIQILKTLDNGDSVDGETMEYILEQVGMTDQMLRQLVMGNPESKTKDLLEEKISLIEKRLECIKRTTKDINEIILDNQDKIYKAVGYDNLEVLQRSISDIGIALDLNDNEPIEQNWYKLFY